MKKRSGSTWIDLTDMLVWRGSYTGIQRVTYEYARRFEKDNARFFIYDAIDGRYVEIGLDDIHKETVIDTRDTEVDIVPLKHRMRRIISRPYRKLSPNARAFLSPYVSAMNHTVRSVIHYSQKLMPAKDEEVKPVLFSEHRHRPTVVFETGDTVILLGAGWNDARTLDGLIQYKKHTPIRIVQHVNDILPIYQPQLFADELPRVFMPYIEKVIRNVDIITVISQATKRDIKIFYREHGLSGPQVEVVRLGDNPKSAVVATRPTHVNIQPDNYILTVGTFEVRKNYQILYQAVKLAQIEDRKLPTIVIAGRPGWLSGDIRHIITRDPFVQERMIWLDSVDDEELEWLYKNCMFTVFPSIAEGWGLPVAESLNHGKMCLASGTSAMLEIGDGLVDYFLPYDPRECMEKMQYYVAEARYRGRNERIMKEYKAFTWDDSYQQLKSATKVL